MKNLIFVRDNRRNNFSTRVGNQILVLARAAEGMALDEDTEFMIVGKLGTHPRGWIVEPVTDEVRLINHSGFECTGSMCRTLAYDLATKQWLTPGRLNGLITTVDNVNHDWRFPVWDQAELDAIKASPHFKPENLIMKTDGDTEKGNAIASYAWGYRPTVPGKAYVKRGESRVHGVPSFDELEILP